MRTDSCHVTTLGAVGHTGGAIVVAWVVESITTVLNVDAGTSVLRSAHVKELSRSDAAARIVSVQCESRTACLTHSSHVAAQTAVGGTSGAIVKAWIVKSIATVLNINTNADVCY